MKRYLSPIDAAFLRMESKRTPMHVGAMMTFRLPDDAAPDFVRKLMQKMREQPFMPAPFGYRLARGRLARFAPAWEEAVVDMDYHMRHSALPWPGGERELGILVSRLHSHPLDLSRPLWECHLIEGLENRRFALYFKAHHCAIDGMGAMRMVQNWLTPDPTNMEAPGLEIVSRPSTSKSQEPVSGFERFKRPLRSAAEQANGLKELVRGLAKMSRGKDSTARAALSTPRTLFNVEISQQRRLGTQILDLKRIKAVADAAEVSVNDALLGIVGSVVRRYLIENDALPKKSILASVPVGLPRPDGKPGNAVVGFVVPLGTDIDDPAERLQRIRRMTTRSKQELLEMPPAAQSQFALLGLSPLLLGQMTGTLARLPPFFNFVVSNVVLSKDPLYVMGAQLEAMYPLSFLFDGYALNITLIGYAGKVAVGFLGCRDVIPRLQRLAIYTADALTELEQAVGIVAAPVKAKVNVRAKRKASRA